jgi:hypothetical protein
VEPREQEHQERSNEYLNGLEEEAYESDEDDEGDEDNGLEYYLSFGEHAADEWGHL